MRAFVILLALAAIGCKSAESRARADILGVWSGTGGVSEAMANLGAAVAPPERRDRFRETLRSTAMTIEFLEDGTLRVDGSQAMGKWTLAGDAKSVSLFLPEKDGTMSASGLVFDLSEDHKALTTRPTGSFNLFNITLQKEQK